MKIKNTCNNFDNLSMLTGIAEDLQRECVEIIRGSIFCFNHCVKPKKLLKKDVSWICERLTLAIREAKRELEKHCGLEEEGDGNA